MKQKPKGRVVKCQHCEEFELFDERHKMKIYEKGSRKFYVHEECYEEYIIKKEKQNKETLERDNLIAYVKSIHNNKVIPSSFFFRIGDLRNGNYDNFSNITRMYSKEGYTYPTIQKAYELAKNKIQNARAKVKFKDEHAEYYYCLKIAISYLSKAEKMIKKAEREKIRMESNENVQHLSLTEKEKTVYKKREYKDDILDFMD